MNPELHVKNRPVNQNDKLKIVTQKSHSKIWANKSNKKSRFLQDTYRRCLSCTHRGVGHAAAHRVGWRAVGGRVPAAREARARARQAGRVQARRLRVDHLLGRVHVIYQVIARVHSRPSETQRRLAKKVAKMQRLQVCGTRDPFNSKAEL